MEYKNKIITSKSFFRNKICNNNRKRLTHYRSLGETKAVATCKHQLTSFNIINSKLLTED